MFYKSIKRVGRCLVFLYFCPKLLLFIRKMAENHTKTAELPQWLNIFVYIVLIVILAVFGDLFTLVLGAIGVTIAFVAYFNSARPEEDHH